MFYASIMGEALHSGVKEGNDGREAEEGPNEQPQKMNIKEC